jgi:transcriptional regulator with XRE-family HTH domain
VEDISDKAISEMTSISSEEKSLKPSIATNLRKLMTLANINENELGRRTHIKQPIIHRLLSGKNKNPKLLTIKPLADYFMLSVSQLIGEQEIVSSWQGFTTKDHHGWTEVPLMNWEQFNKLSEHKLSKFIVTECNISQNAFAIYITDQSMEPLFPEKCIVIVEAELEPNNDNYVVIKTANDELILRHFMLISGDKFTNPLNHKFGTICKLSKKDKILGTVVRTIYDHRLP